MLGGFRIKAPKRLLLDVPAKKPCDEILGEARAAELRETSRATGCEVRRARVTECGRSRPRPRRDQTMSEAWQSGVLA